MKSGQGKGTTAVHTTYRLIRARFRAENHYWLGLALGKLGRHARARAALLQSLEIDPTYDAAHRALNDLAP